jgi:hypothetical protein
MKWVFKCGMLIGLAISLPALAREAVIETREGKTFYGQVALREGQIFILNAEKDLYTRTHPTNLLWAAFEKSKLADPLLPQRGDGRFMWNTSDIGAPVMPGTLEFNPVGRISCTGTNIAGARDEFYFVFQRMRGDREIVVRLLHVPRGNTYAKAGVMMREYLTPESKNVFVALNPGRGGSLQIRERTRDETLEAPRPDLFVPQWLKLRRRGNMFSVYKSGNGHRWTLVQELSVAMREEIYGGLAVTGLTIWPAGAGSDERVAFDNLQIGTSLPQNAYIPTVHLQSGSVLSGRIDSATPEQIRFEGPLPPPPVALAPVSRIQFQWVPYRFGSVLNQNRPGLLLASGEFIEGAFTGISQGRISISSVLFGVRSYDLNHEAMAMVLKPLAPQPHAYEVITDDNSKWLASNLEIGRSELVIQDMALGTRRIPIYELMEIRSVPFTRTAPAQVHQAQR